MKEFVRMGALAAAFGAASAALGAQEMFPFVIGANADGTASDVSFLLRAPTGCDGFVRTEGEHFVNDRGTVRFNGVNLVGPACFPSHAEAERLAARLAHLGINMVRLHYFDTWAYGSNFMKAPMPALFKNDPKSSCIIDEAQRERLEYLVAQFKKRGIYLNVNLHVAQELDERDGIPKTPWANRGPDFFYWPIVEKEREYARNLLSHVNPYTGLAMKDDPVVAIVEINNENGMFSTWTNGLLDGGDRFGREYQDEFRRQWREFSGSEKDYLRAKAPGPAYTQAETNRFFRFLAHVDGAYFTGMRDFLRREVGVKVPISYTQLDYCTPHTLAESELVDVHLYWTHPSVVNVPKGVNVRRGPHRGIEWYFRNESMFASGRYEKPYDEDFVPHRATMRVKGRPFTVSETSSPYPNWYGAEFNPFLRALAAFQDWAGVVTHSWNNDLDPAPRHTTFFFSYAARTDCLAHFPAMAAMFLRGDVAPAAERVDVGESSETYFGRIAANGLAHAGVHASPARISGGRFRSSEILVRGIGVDLSRDETSVPPLPKDVLDKMDMHIYAGPQMRLDQSDPQHPFFVVTASNAKFFSGFSSMRPFDLGDGVSVAPGTTRLGWCTVSLVSLGGNGFGPGSRVLLAATGLSHNGGAKFRHLEGSRWTSRDDDFGREDTVVEGVRARIVLPCGAASCRALDGDGRPVRDVPVRCEGGSATIDIGPEFRTVWYEITAI